MSNHSESNNQSDRLNALNESKAFENANENSNENSNPNKNSHEKPNENPSENPQETKSSASNDNETIQTLTQDLEEARRKAAENWDLFLRARADGENAQRRARIDIENERKYGNERFARELLLVADSLDHGLTASEKDSSNKALREGMELTYRMLLDVFEKFGIQQINPLNESFDPTLHEALSTQVNNEVEPNKVIMVIQKGFKLNDRLLRPARVIVSKRED